MKSKILISWFYMYHGTSFFKHVLSSFSTSKPNITDKDFFQKDISQTEMQTIFDKNDFEYVFNKIYILHPSNDVYKKHTGKSYGFRKISLVETDDEVKKTGTASIWKDIINMNYKIQDEYQYIQQKYPDRSEELYNQYWRNIQHYSPEEQIWWLMNKSNLPEEYKQRIEFINMNSKYKFTDLWDYKKIAEVTYTEVSKIFKKHKEASFYINVSLATKEVQVVWFSLSQGGFLPAETILFESYDVKSSVTDQRFKNFFVKAIPSNILDIIKTEISLFSTKPTGKKRYIADNLFETYLKQGFAITLIGERGIGKTNIIENSENVTKPVIINCTAFNDVLEAEYTIFGNVKDAYGKGIKPRDGAFIEAENNILVFDEISNLSTILQPRLMEALRTYKGNTLKIRRLGEKKYRFIKCSVIFTTSKSVNELRDSLLPELFDRIMQLVIELPPLRDTPEELPSAFQDIWVQLKFQEKYIFSKYISSETINWLKLLPLKGNYRDLQRIAIFYKAYLDFPEILRDYLNEKSPLEYAQSQYKKYISEEKYKKGNEYFNENKTTKLMIKTFKKDLSEWLISKHYNAPNAVKYLKEELHEDITIKTLYTWKNTKI